MQTVGLADTVHEGEMEAFVWDSHKPWVPRPLLSIHVRIGDKGREMRLYPFKVYMQLAQRLRLRFPDAKHVWLSTEMQVCYTSQFSTLGTSLLTYFAMQLSIAQSVFLILEAKVLMLHNRSFVDSVFMYFYYNSERDKCDKGIQRVGVSLQ